MRRSFVLATALGLLLAAPAAAKGPSAATITGPGLRGAIHLQGDPEGDADTPFGRLVQGAGFAQQVFRPVPDSTLHRQPKVELGPRYDVVYTMRTPTGTSLIRQQLYPYAKGGPLTYVRPGQPFYGSMDTRGGWIQAPQALLPMLVSLGFPPRAPEVKESGLGPGAWAGIAAAIAAAVAAAAVLAQRRRRSGESAG